MRFGHLLTGSRRRGSLNTDDPRAAFDFGVDGRASRRVRLILGFVVQLPALGWLGFAVVSAVVLGLGALGPLAFEHTRVSAVRPAARNRQEGLLVVADSHCNASALSKGILARVGDATVVHVVVPVRVSTFTS